MSVSRKLNDGSRQFDQETKAKLKKKKRFMGELETKLTLVGFVCLGVKESLKG